MREITEKLRRDRSFKTVCTRKGLPFRICFLFCSTSVIINRILIYMKTKLSLDEDMPVQSTRGEKRDLIYCVEIMDTGSDGIFHGE